MKEKTSRGSAGDARVFLKKSKAGNAVLLGFKRGFRLTGEGVGASSGPKCLVPPSQASSSSKIATPNDWVWRPN